MPLEIVRNDITKMRVDVIVNPTNSRMFGTAGVDGAIHKIAGVKIQEETKKLGELRAGQVKITESYNMPSKYIIHTVGPIWNGGDDGEEEILINCYKNSLNLAIEKGFESIAFPLISSGTFGYPKDRALGTAISTIGKFLLNHEIIVCLVVYDKKAFRLSSKLFLSIEEYIDDNYVDEHKFKRSYMRREVKEELFLNEMEVEQRSDAYQIKSSKRNLKDIIKHVDDTFAQMLFRLIDDRNLKDPVVYKKANVTKQHFSKIRNNIFYKPSKQTVLAFAIALELSMDETNDLLLRAGFALSRSSKFDIIISFFIEEGNYNIFEINEALFAFEQNLLGV